MGKNRPIVVATLGYIIGIIWGLYFKMNIVSFYALIYIFAIYTIMVYVPADVPEIPKVNPTLRKTLKIKSLISLNIIYLFCIFIIKDILLTNLIIYSVFFISLMTTRTIYKIFKNEYGYLTYVPDELI